MPPENSGPTKVAQGMSLFPDGRAVVMSKPPSFDLLTEIASANTIRLATAFAHETGWDILASAISASKAKTFLLTGKSFFQTEPEVLWKWLKLAESGRVEAKLHFEKGITFHPKVLLVDGKRPFAIVGSGNLSRGGLHGNIECAVFIDSRALLSELRGWFDTVYSSNATAAPLTEALILDYERKYKALRKPTNDLRKQQQLLEEELITKAAAAMEYWDEAVSAAKQYLNSSEYQVTYRGRVAGVTRIKRALRYPAFDFDETGWKEFYSIPELGHLIAIRRDGIFRHKARLQKGLRELVGAERNIPKVLDELLSSNGRLHIEGLGVNTISKILAVHDPRRWAVYNSPVADALKKFGYVPPRGASPAEKFIAFTKMMETFKTATGLKDAYALDAFMFDVYDKAKK